MYNICQQLYPRVEQRTVVSLVTKDDGDAFIENYKIETNREFTDDIVPRLPY
jgi:hypothetical protein